MNGGQPKVNLHHLLYQDRNRGIHICYSDLDRGRVLKVKRIKVETLENSSVRKAGSLTPELLLNSRAEVRRSRDFRPDT